MAIKGIGGKPFARATNRFAMIEIAEFDKVVIFHERALAVLETFFSTLDL